MKRTIMNGPREEENKDAVKTMDNSKLSIKSKWRKIEIACLAAMLNFLDFFFFCFFSIVLVLPH